MRECWHEVSEKRPTFSKLVTVISTSLEAMAGYLDLTTQRLAPALTNSTGDDDPVLETDIESAGTQELQEDIQK